MILSMLFEYLIPLSNPNWLQMIESEQYREGKVKAPNRVDGVKRFEI